MSETANSDMFSSVEVTPVSSGHDVEFFTYSDGATAVFSNSGATTVNHNNPTEFTVANDSDEVVELTDLLLSQNTSREPTTFAREQDGYNKNAVDSYIHHVHTLLIRYGTLLKTKQPDLPLSEKEINSGLPKFRSTRVDVLLEELVFTNRLVNFFRKQINEVRATNRALNERIMELEKTVQDLQEGNTEQEGDVRVKSLVFDNLRHGNKP